MTPQPGNGLTGIAVTIPVTDAILDMFRPVDIGAVMAEHIRLAAIGPHHHPDRTDIPRGHRALTALHGKPAGPLTRPQNASPHLPPPPHPQRPVHGNLGTNPETAP